MRITIYCHTNRVNGKRYVGQTIETVEYRWADHVACSRTRRGTSVFHKAIRKYGPAAFDHEILDVVTTIDGANRAEQVWITQKNALVPNGYNVATGGNSGYQLPRKPRPQTVCAGWDGACPRSAQPPRKAFNPAKARRRNGQPWRCRWCARQKALASMGPEQRSAIARKVSSGLTTEQRREQARSRPRGANGNFVSASARANGRVEA